MQEITAASIEQNSGVDQINNSIQQLNHVTQQNAVVSDEISKNAKALHDYADELKDMVSFFTIEEMKQKSRSAFSSKNTVKEKTESAKQTVSAPKITEEKEHKRKPKDSSGGVNLNMFGDDSADSDYEKF